MDEQVGHAASGLRHLQYPAALDVAHPGAQPLDRGRDAVARDPDHLGGPHLLLVEPLAPGIVERAYRQFLEQERAVHQAAVHVEEQLGIERVVGQARDRIGAVDARVDVVDAGRRGVCLGLRPERDRVRQDQGALQAFPGVALVEARGLRAGDHQGVRGLHQHGSRPAEQHGDLPVHLPAHAVGPEIPQIFRHGHGIGCYARRTRRALGEPTRWRRPFEPSELVLACPPASGDNAFPFERAELPR